MCRETVICVARGGLMFCLAVLLGGVVGCGSPGGQTPPPTTVAPAAAATPAALTSTPAVTEPPATPKPRPTQAVTVRPTAKPTPEPTPVPEVREVREDPAATPEATQAPTPRPIPKPTPTAVPAPTAPPVLSVADIVDSLTKVMVRVKTDSGNGSGIIMASDGHILTANHVVEKFKEVKVVMPDDKEVTGKVLGRDEIRDVGLVKVEAQNLKAVPFGRSEDLRVGDEIMAIGFPLDIKGSATVSKGIVSAFRKDPDTGATSIQTDAPVNPGNSGGALVNRKGEVVGVIVSKYVGTGVEGLAFASAWSEITPVLPRLKDGVFIEAPYAKAEATKKFESKKYLYSFSYPESWKITSTAEDKLEIKGSGATVGVLIRPNFGAIIDLNAVVKSVASDYEKEPGFKLIASKGVSHNLVGIEMVFEKVESGTPMRVTAFIAQTVRGIVIVGASIRQTDLKKQQANIDGFFKSLDIAP